MKLPRAAMAKNSRQILNIFLLAILTALSAIWYIGYSRGGGTAAEQPETVEILYFHDTVCASCDPEEEFYALINEKIGDVLPLYDHVIYTYNYSQTEGDRKWSQIAEIYGLDETLDTFPALVINGKAQLGEENVGKNMREMFLTAGEDVSFSKEEYARVHDMSEDLFKGFRADASRPALVYFYRTTCEECGQVAPIIDGLPEDVSVFKLNSRAGNNRARILKFFEAYQVPQEDQMVPIVFLRDTYLSGYEEISEKLEALLAEGVGQPFVFPKK